MTNLEKHKNLIVKLHKDHKFSCWAEENIDKDWKHFSYFLQSALFTNWGNKEYIEPPALLNCRFVPLEDYPPTLTKNKIYSIKDGKFKGDNDYYYPAIRSALESKEDLKDFFSCFTSSSSKRTLCYKEVKYIIINED